MPQLADPGPRFLHQVARKGNGLVPEDEHCDDSGREDEIEKLVGEVLQVDELVGEVQDEEHGPLAEDVIDGPDHVELERWNADAFLWSAYVNETLL